MSPSLYPAMCYDADLTPDSFGPEIDAICQEIQDSCAGFGTDEGRLLKAMGSMDPETRCKVPLRFKEMFGKDLKEVMKSETGKRDFGKACQLLAVSPVECDCNLIDMACKGLGTNELLLFTTVCGRSNKDMEVLKKKFFDLYTKDLGRVLDSELRGDLEKLVFNVLQAAEEEYDPDFHTEDKMAEDVKKLYDMGQGKFGTDEAGLFKILCASPPEYLKKMNLAYAEKYGYTLSKSLETELKGATSEAAVFNLNMKLKPAETVADLIDRACKGFGTQELLLTATLIRYQPIMEEVKNAHVEKYGSTVADRIRSETKRDYEKILLEIIGEGAEE